MAGAPRPARSAGLWGAALGALALVSAGLTNREIAERLAMTEGTAKLHVSAAMRRIGARDRTEQARRSRGA